MTVQTNLAIKTYAGNGVTLGFPIPFRFLANSHIRVTLTPAGGVAVPQVETTNYSIEGARDANGGNLTMVVAPPAGYTLTIQRNMPFTQLVDYKANDPFPEESAEDIADERTMEGQQLKEILSRAITLPPELAGYSGQLPYPQPLWALRWNAAGTGIENYSISPFSDPGGSANIGFIQLGTGAVARTAQDKMRDLFSVKDFGALGNGTSDDTAFIQAALNAATRGVYFPPGTYRITSGLTVAGKTEFAIASDGATLNVDAAIIGLAISSCDGFKTTGELNFTGLNTATGFTVGNMTNSQLAGFRAKGLLIGGILGANAGKTYGGVSVPDQTRLEGFTAIACGTGFRVDGEYYEMLSPHIMGCSGAGLHIRGGNFAGSGGIINGNRIGVFVEGGVIANSDHGRLCGASINHNLAAGVYIKNTDYAFHISGCDIWASIGDGTANGQLTEAGRNTSFGVYLQNCDAINMVGNTIARNRVNVGIDGIATSDLSNNNYISDPARTTSHLKEYGANHSTYGLNAQNIYGPNSFDGALFGGGTIRYELLTTNLTQANRCGRSVGTTGSNMSKADGTVSGAYDFVGDNELLYLTSDTPATVTISAALSNQSFGVLFDSVSFGTKNVTVTGALALTSQTAGVSVAGNVVTFKNDGLYWFSPTADLRWTISCAGGHEAVLTPTFTGTWANLAGGFETVGYWKDINGDVVLRGAMNVLGASNTSAFTLPAGYRPAAKVAMPIGCDAGKSGFVVINTDGTVVPTYEAASTFVSLSGLRFRPA